MCDPAYCFRNGQRPRQLRQAKMTMRTSQGKWEISHGEEYHKANASQLTEQLYLAACRAVTSKCLLDLKITSIVNATLELPTVAYQKQDTIQIAVEDKVGAKLNIYFDLIADKINQVHLAGGKILIYCRAGQSRSATLCIAYFMKYHDMSYDQAFQFVRARRPIIHPNRGFVHQLKEYEVKLHTKPVFAVPGVTRNNSFKLASRLSVAVDSPVDDPPFVDADSTWDKPLKPFRPGRGRAVVTLHEPLATIADHQEFIVVETCGETDQTKPPPLEMLVVGMGETRGVACSATNPNTIGALPETEPLNARAKRRAAFTKLTKPNDIAVSSLNIPLDFVVPCDNKVFKLQTKPEHCSSAIPDLLEAHAVAQEVLPECLGTLAKALTPLEKATTVITRGRQVATTLLPCVLLWPAPCDPKWPPAGRQAQVAAATKARTFTPTRRNSTRTRPSVTLPKLQPVTEPVTQPTSDTPVKALVKRCTEYKVCATQLASPPLWQNAAGRATEQDWPVKKTEKSVKVVRGCNSIAVSTTVAWQAAQPAPLLNIPIQSYHKLDFSFTGFETSQIASKTTAVFLDSATTEFGKNMTVIREYPYYSSVLLTSALEMSRAHEEVKLNVKWFKQDKPKTQRPDPVELIMKVSEQKQAEQRRKVSQPSVKWGTERCLTDDFVTPLPISPFLPTTYNAICYRVMPQREHLTDSLPFIWQKTEILGKFYVPHYNPVLVTRTIPPTVQPVVLTYQPLVLDMANQYTSPSTVFAGGQEAGHSAHMDCLSLAAILVPHIQTDFQVEDIPDEILDINEIKRVIADDGESNKCKIWFDVFKRTLMRKRPTYPKVSRSDFLPTAAVSNCILLEFPLLLSTDSFSPQTASTSRQRPPLAVASILEVKEIEKYTEFTRFVKPTLVCEKFSSSIVLTDHYIIGLGVGWCWESYAPITDNSNLPPQLERANSTVSFPNRLYTVSEVQVRGLTGDWSPSSHHRQARTAFTVLTRPHLAAESHTPLRLGVASDLPEYQFVQDIEEQADVEFHRPGDKGRAVQQHTDAFWFFAMETATAPELKSFAGTPQGPSNYQLFLPDSEMASKIGQETMFPEDTVVASAESLSVVNPGALLAEVMLEMTESKPPLPRIAPEVRVARRGSQRVSFQPEKDDEQTKRIKTIYYGRDRSKNRTRLKDVPKDTPKEITKEVPKQRGVVAERPPRRDKSSNRYNEAEIMEKLSNSVSEANDILTRRRGREAERELYSPVPSTPVPSTPYTDYRSPRLTTRSEERHARRSRDTELNRRETERYERNKKMMEESKKMVEEQKVEPSTAPEATQSAGFGLLSFAQNFLGGQSRRDQSKNRSRDLVRKSRRNL